MRLKLSDRQQQEWYDVLAEFFLSKGVPKEDISEKIKEILNQAQEGWPRAPKDIATRIKMKSGYQWKSHSNLRANPDTLPSVIEDNNNRVNTMRDLYQWEKSLKSSEQIWWRKRESQYRSEFEFNKSSDEPLLFQLLVEELTQQRLAAIILKDPKMADAYSKLMTDSNRRMQDLQTKLGITREQRADILDDAEGDIASLSIDFDEKVKRAKLQIKEWAKEEEKFKFIKDQAGPINPLPPFRKIEALLGMDPEGNLGSNLDTMEISKILNEANKIHDETLEELEEEHASDDDEKINPGSINPHRKDEVDNSGEDDMDI